MPDKQVIAYLRYLHGAYNAVVFLLFIFQGNLGMRIRRQRKALGTLPAEAVRRHRKAGPVLAVLGVLGFFAGLALVYLDKGRFLEYPLHFITGAAIASSIVSTYLVSRRIKGPGSVWRGPHFSLGMFILFLYAAQVLFGLGILF